MTSYKTPSKAPLCPHCKRARTVSGQAQWICEPCRLAASHAGQKLAMEARRSCPNCGEPVAPRTDQPGTVCVPCRKAKDRERYAAEKERLAAEKERLAAVRSGDAEQDVQAILAANGEETMRRVMERIETDTVPMRLNPASLRRGVTLPGEPLYVPALTARYKE